MASPLLVHLVFHPASAEACRVALVLHGALNDDPALPGLRIPTALVPADGTQLPTKAYDLDVAEHSVVVLLADDKMVIEPVGIPPEHLRWGAFAAELRDRCASGRHRFLPIQLSEHAWPLDDRLRDTNFPPAFREPEAKRDAWIVRRVVVEMCRFLMSCESGEKVPLRLFLSHAKQDIAEAPRPFKALVKHLDATQPVEAWIDSGDIPAGSRFADEIKSGVQNSALLVLATAHYSSRPWCRTEVLLAKEHDRPIVVADVLRGIDVRSFPYLGNVPVIPWSQGGAARAVDLVLKEQLRRLHVERLLKQQARADDVVLSVPPELATLVARPRGRDVLYPDPPLGDEELAVLEPLGHRLTTPLQRAGRSRTLQQRVIALSLSESDDLDRHGIFKSHLDAATVEVSRHLLVRGASLAYGGHLGSRGYTLVLCDLLGAHSANSGLPPAERIRNYVGWPLPYATEEKKRAALTSYVQFIRVGRPHGIEALEPKTFVAEPRYFPATSPVRRLAWARGMTAMRERQSAETDARVILGGKIGPTVTAAPDGSEKRAWYQSRIPGVVEECLLTLRLGKPVYILGGFGGAAALLADLLEGRTREDFTWDFHRQAPHAEAMRKLYEQQGLPWEDYATMADEFRRTGVGGVAAKNGLGEAENRELFRTRDVTRAIELLLRGLASVLGA